MKKLKNGNITEYYTEDGILLLTIKELGNDRFETINNSFRLVGYCKNLDDYRTEVGIEVNQSVGKNGRFYDTKKLKQHNESWFVYILKEKGFVKKTLPTR